MFDEIKTLPKNVRDYIIEKANICKPDHIKVCDGSEEESKILIEELVKQGSMKNLSKYENCWLVRTDPADVARVESKTFISTKLKRTTIPDTSDPKIQGKLGNWMSESDMEVALNDRFPGCMKGRTMYVIPFSMGPIGGPISKIGIQLTDSSYVVCSMKIMTRMGHKVLEFMTDSTPFVKALHSVGVPLPTERNIINGWPCNPEKTLIAHLPAKNEICSFGSGYGGNSLLGKKCFALRLGSILARDEKWFAEHMLILGLTPPHGEKIYITAAFPSACGKTNLAMIEPTIPGYKVECVGDDIAWMKFDSNGTLRAINPEAGFFGVAPGTSHSTNPNAMKCIQKNTIFTNVAETSDGGYFWEGLEDEVDLDNLEITDWHGKPWTKNCGRPAAHPNSRFCCPASQCPIIDTDWESPSGVPISAVIFGGRRPEGVPLVYETLNWRHGVFTGASVRSEATAAAEHEGKAVMNDPFAMRPFFGYNFGDYLKHWLSFANESDLKLPRIYHVNWFRKSKEDGSFLWPGFGENGRVLDWIAKRVAGKVVGEKTSVGIIPKFEELNLDGLKLNQKQFKELFSLPIEFWTNEFAELEKYFEEQVGKDLPEEIKVELKNFRNRF